MVKKKEDNNLEDSLNTLRNCIHKLESEGYNINSNIFFLSINSEIGKMSNLIMELAAGGKSLSSECSSEYINQLVYIATVTVSALCNYLEEHDVALGE